ncbi:MAG: efflux RND transporter periplasmic adaptor subunit [Planctomycetes bacterium]|nr:efflux RND transporter periplasmic adaptor subunit [Planctomycetota bacterium]
MRQNVLTIGVFAILIGLFAFAANDWRLPWAKEPAHGADWCEAHKVALSTCEKCNIRLARGGTFTTREREPKEGECPNTLVRITLAPEAAKETNLEFHTLELRAISEVIRANAETLYPPSKYARVAARIPGIIRDVKAVLGQEVEAGTPLAILESTDFGNAKSDYLQALTVLDLRQQTYEQEKTLFEKKITAGRELLRARTDLEEAKLALERAAQKLAALGLSADQIKGIVEKRDTSPFMEIPAPFRGTVVEATAVSGETAAPDRPIYVVAAMERLWISIDVYETDLSKVEKDQRVAFTVDGIPGQRFPGKVVATGGEVDDRTRTVHVFAEVKNVQGLLRAKMFGRAEITVKPPEPKLLVPKAAVQNDGDCFLVFVSPIPGVFQARKIEVGRVFEGGYEVSGGLAAGEKVVTTGSFLLKTEVLRGQMGAGCCPEK